MKALKYLIIKEFIQISRTRSMIAITLGVPIVQLIIIGFCISGDVIHVPTVITDLDRTPKSRSLVSKLENTRYLDVRYRSNDNRNNEPSLQSDKAIIAVIIPRNFEKELIRGETPDIYIMADAQNTNVALTGMGYVQRIILSWAVSFGVSKTSQADNLNVINLESRVLYNPELKAVYYMVPGIIVLLVSVITMLLTAMAIVGERGEKGTLEQLMVTPITRHEVILGKTIPFAILGLVELTVSLIIAKIVYNIIIIGSLPLFYGMTIVFIFCTLGIGIFISTITQTQQQALFTAWFILVFCIIMSGFFFPLENMPKTMYYLTYINPLRYYLTIVRELFLKGSGIAELWHETLALAVIAGVVLTASVGRFHKRLG
jgi:ABC-2 type transport system permease protein